MTIDTSEFLGSFAGKSSKLVLLDSEARTSDTSCNCTPKTCSTCLKKLSRLFESSLLKRLIPAPRFEGSLNPRFCKEGPDSITALDLMLTFVPPTELRPWL